MDGELSETETQLKVDNAWLKGNLTTVWSVPRLDKDKDKNQDKDKGKDKYKDKECRGVIWPLCEVGPGRTKHLSGSKVAAKQSQKQPKERLYAWNITPGLAPRVKVTNWNRSWTNSSSNWQTHIDLRIFIFKREYFVATKFFLGDAQGKVVKQLELLLCLAPPILCPVIILVFQMTSYVKFPRFSCP